jgi:hypothetical protein
MLILSLGNNSCAAGYEGRIASQQAKEQRGHKHFTLIISETEFSQRFSKACTLSLKPQFSIFKLAAI